MPTAATMTPETLKELITLEIMSCGVPHEKASQLASSERFINPKIEGSAYLTAGSRYFQFRRKTEAVHKFITESGCNITYADYIKKGPLKHHQLFYQAPETRIKNIKDVVEGLNELGCEITLTQYITSALVQPTLFCRDPENIISNLQDVISAFNEKGCELSLQRYVEAALKQPQLFYYPVETVLDHFAAAMKLHTKYDVIQLPASAEENPQQYILDTMLGWPVSLSLATDNFKLRAWEERISGDAGKRPTFLTILAKPRKKVEEDLAHELNRTNEGHSSVRQILLEAMVEDKLLAKKHLPQKPKRQKKEALSFQELIEQNIPESEPCTSR